MPGKRTPHKNGNGGAGEPRIVITVRMSTAEKTRLHRHCLKRGAKEGRTVSLNEAVVDLIKAAPL